MFDGDCGADRESESQNLVMKHIGEIISNDVQLIIIRIFLYIYYCQ